MAAASDTSATARTAARSRNITAEWFLVVVFAMAERRDGDFVGRSDEEVVAADALDGGDGAVAQPLRGLVDGFPGVLGQALARGVPERDARAAHGAGVGSRVETPVGGVVVFALAGRALAKGAHRRARPVVGQIFQNRVARAALRAVDKRVTVPAILRCQQFGAAIGAEREIGWNGRFDHEQPQFCWPRSQNLRRAGPDSAGTRRLATECTRAAGGGCSRRRCINLSTASSRPAVRT